MRSHETTPTYHVENDETMQENARSTSASAPAGRERLVRCGPSGEKNETQNCLFYVFTACFVCLLSLLCGFGGWSGGFRL